MEQVVKHPMDFGTIRDRMDAKDGTGYKHIQEICDDVHLVFSNAMSYNQDGSDVHTMAKTLSDKFEEKWKALVEPKLAEEVLPFVTKKHLYRLLFLLFFLGYTDVQSFLYLIVATLLWGTNVTTLVVGYSVCKLLD